MYCFFFSPPLVGFSLKPAKPVSLKSLAEYTWLAPNYANGLLNLDKLISCYCHVSGFLSPDTNCCNSMIVHTSTHTTTDKPEPHLILFSIRAVPFSHNSTIYKSNCYNNVEIIKQTSRNSHCNSNCLYHNTIMWIQLYRQADICSAVGDYSI